MGSSGIKKLIWDGIEYEYALECAPVLAVAVELRKRNATDKNGSYRSTEVNAVLAVTQMEDSWHGGGEPCVAFECHPTEWSRVDLLPAPAGAVRYNLRVYAPQALYYRVIPLGIGTPEAPLDSIEENALGAILAGALAQHDPVYRAEIQARAKARKARDAGAK